jgi:hypothetical protein
MTVKITLLYAFIRIIENWKIKALSNHDIFKKSIHVKRTKNKFGATRAMKAASN